MLKNKKKKNIFKSIKDFFKNIISETKKVIWPSKKDLVKYSVATLSFMVIICLFFVGTDLLIALITYVKGLIG